MDDSKSRISSKSRKTIGSRVSRASRKSTRITSLLSKPDANPVADALPRKTAQFLEQFMKRENSGGRR